MRDSFIFYRSFFDATKPLNDTQKAQLFDAICEYALNQKETETEPMVCAMFSLIKPQLDANTKRFENGKKGGRPSNKKTKPKPNQNQDETKHKPNANVNANVNVNDIHSAFASFWSAYPKKIGKVQAEKAFAKALKADVDINRIMRSLEEHKKLEQWIRDSGQYIPHASTWLNQKRFDDELQHREEGNKKGGHTIGGYYV